MSVKLSSYVWDGCAASGMKIAKVAIMARLADFANDQGICWPSVATIARQIGAGESTVRTALGELERTGWIMKKNRRVGNRNASNVYRINVEKLHEAAQVSDTAKRDISKCNISEFDTTKPDTAKCDISEFDTSELSKINGFHPPKSGGDPSVTSKQDPSDKKTVSQSPATDDRQQPDGSKIDYLTVLEAYHRILPEMPQVLDMTIERKIKLHQLWKKFDFNQDKWLNYLYYIAKKCRWMLQERPNTVTGTTWRRKNFDYLITEKCYLTVREGRANDLPNVAKVDIASRDDAFTRLVAQRREPRNAVEKLALAAANRIGLGRMNEVTGRITWKSIWVQAQLQASEYPQNDRIKTSCG